MITDNAVTQARQWFMNQISQAKYCTADGTWTTITPTRWELKNSGLVEVFIEIPAESVTREITHVQLIDLSGNVMTDDAVNIQCEAGAESIYFSVRVNIEKQ